jgi:hypothetical protein
MMITGSPQLVTALSRLWRLSEQVFAMATPQGMFERSPAMCERSFSAAQDAGDSSVTQ